MNSDFNILTNGGVVCFFPRTVRITDFFKHFFCLFSLQKVYKESYEKNRGFSINYCETPKFQMDTVLKQFTDVTKHLTSKHCFYSNPCWRYRYIYFYFFRHITKISMKMRWKATILAAMKMCICFTARKLKKWRMRYYSFLYFIRFVRINIHSPLILYIFPHHLHLFNLQQLYKADYEDIKTRCFFPQTLTPEYEAIKKLENCKDVSSICVFKIIYFNILSFPWYANYYYFFFFIWLTEKLSATSR